MRRKDIDLEMDMRYTLLLASVVEGVKKRNESILDKIKENPVSRAHNKILVRVNQRSRRE